jgi:hypothetical protein
VFGIKVKDPGFIVVKSSNIKEIEQEFKADT